MFKKSLLQSRMEFLWDTDMIDTRTTMKCKYEKDKCKGPDCEAGRVEGVLETPETPALLRPAGGQRPRGGAGGRSELPHQGHW